MSKYLTKLYQEVAKLRARIAELETLCSTRQAAIERLTAECAGLELMLSEGEEFDPCDDCEYKKGERR